MSERNQVEQRQKTVQTLLDEVRNVRDRIEIRDVTIGGVSVLKGEPIPFQWAPDRFANGVPSRMRDDRSYVRSFVHRRERFTRSDGGDHLTVADLSEYSRGPYPVARPPQTNIAATPQPSTSSGVSE